MLRYPRFILNLIRGEEFLTVPAKAGIRGRTDSQVKCRTATFCCLIDCTVCSNFISWFLKTEYTCEIINKSSKSNSCYIDSDFVKEKISVPFSEMSILYRSSVLW